MNTFNNLKVGHKIFFGYFAVLVLMVSIVTVLLFSLNNMTEDFTFLIEHDQPVLSNAHKLHKLVIDMETGERGFLITGQEKFLEPYHNAIKEFDTLLETEKQLVNKNPSQVAILEKIGQLHDEWNRKAAVPAIAKRRKVNKATVTAKSLQELLKKEVGKRILDKMRGILAQMETNLTTKGDLESVILTVKIAKDMVDQETGQRGFIITGEENFLEPYQQGQAQLKTDILALRSRLIKDSENFTLLNQVEFLSKQWLEKAGKPEIQARRKMKANPVTMDDVSAFIQTGVGKNILDAIRVKFDHFIQKEVDSNFVRSHHAEQNAEWVWTLIISLTLGSIIFLLILGIIISRRITRPLIQITQMANQIAAGHLKQMVKVKSDEIQKITQRQDEMGDIGRSYEALANYFQSVIVDIVQISQKLAQSDKNIIPQAEYRGDFAQIQQALAKAASKLADSTAENIQQDWLKTGQAQLNDMMSGEQKIITLAKKIIAFLTTYISASVGLFYLLKEVEQSDQPPILQMIASYAYTANDKIPDKFLLGEGLVGQVALERKPLFHTHTPEEYIHIIQSGLTNTIPCHVMLLPCLYDNVLKAVIEIGSSQTFSPFQQEFLQLVMPNIGIAINTAESRSRMQELLQQSQRQTEELQTQSEELKTQQDDLQQMNRALETQRDELQHQNEELQSQSEELQSQSEELQTQQDELRHANTELEKRTQELEFQKANIQQKNVALEKTQAAIEIKAKELEVASQYKSEFLANMSHELRTPLNSLLILAQMLASNKEGNLTDKQIEYAQVIHNAGSDLLTLINDILDISKVEAGKMDIHPKPVSLSELVDMMAQKFQPLAQNKGVNFQIQIAEEVPSVINTDIQRLQQILNNLLSNAFKFTQEGEVRLEIAQSPLTPLYQSGELSTSEEKSPQAPLYQSGELPASKEKSPQAPLYQSGELQSSTADFPLSQRTTTDSPLSQRGVGGDFPIIAFNVIDSGIGIPEDKQQVIFEAFQQVDGTTSRRYGGTGLGLSISRQLAKLLGGEIHLKSELGKGSTFTLYLPKTLEVQSSKTIQDSSVSQTAVKEEFLATISDQAEIESSITDDRDAIQPEDKIILIMEDDRKFARFLMEVAREKAFKCLMAEDGQIGLQLVEQYQPHAIILDISLPKLDGWTVMERLKNNPDTRHIPVYFISGAEPNVDANQMGAIGYLQKPIDMEQLGKVFNKIAHFMTETVKTLLVIVDDKTHQQNIMSVVKGKNVEITVAETMTSALESLKETVFDCLILDLDIEQQTGSQLLEKMQQKDNRCQIPLIAYANRGFTPTEEALLRQYAKISPIKSVQSVERLLDEVTVFLHQLVADLPDEKRNLLKMVHDKTLILSYKKVLVVDDDSRNMFAIATVLENYDMEVILADNGHEALELLDEHQDIAIVLMDIMMPEMDGYEAMRQIRKQPRFRQLPIIALTAKAMKGDKAKCIEAGANDYLSKPVDTDKLISLMRVWLYR